MLQILAATMNPAVYSALTLRYSEFHYSPSQTSVWLEQGRETMTRVPKMAYGTGHSLLSQFFKFLFPHQRLYIVNNMYIYIHTYLTAYRLCINYSRYEIILRGKRFYKNRERCKVLTGYLSLPCWASCDWANR
jgi:hypothetical protein